MTQIDIRATYRRELSTLQDELIRLGSMVDSAIKRAMHALKFRDINLARDVISNDAEINNLRFAIEEACIKLIAQQQPMAGDLRHIISVMSIVLDLERMGDHAAGMATIAVQIGDQPPLKPLVDLPRMSDMVREMLRQSLDAFIARDHKQAKKIIARDGEVDDLFKQIFRELLTFMIEDPSTITRAMYLQFVSHNLERIGDRVTNICERVEFVATGRLAETSSGDSNLALDDEV